MPERISIQATCPTKTMPLLPRAAGFGQLAGSAGGVTNCGNTCALLVYYTRYGVTVDKFHGHKIKTGGSIKVCSDMGHTHNA